MARLSKYVTDTTVEGNDRIIGTDATTGFTKNFTVTQLAAFVDANYDTDTTYTAGTGLNLTSTTFSIDSTVTTLTGSQTLTNKTLTSPVINTGVSGTAIKDEDDLSSDSATHLATQQSIKAYVDAGAGYTAEKIQDIVGAMVTGNTETNIAVTYQDGDGTLDFVATGTSYTAGDGITLNTAEFDLDAALTTVTSILNTSLVTGRDADNQIKYSTDDEIIFRVAGGDGVTMKASGEIEATSLDISGDADIDGTMEADAYTVDGATLQVYIEDTVGAMLDGTETGIAVSYDSTDNNLDFVVGTLNQDTTGTAAIATTVTVADESSDTTCFPLFATAATGNLGPKSGTNLTFNSATGILTATGFAGPITGNVTGDASGSAGTVTTIGNLTGDVTSSNRATTIAADAVHASMINDDLISGSASALTSGLASTDELLISDAGTLKNMDVSVLQTYMQSNLTFTSNTDVDVNNANLLTRLAALESSGGTGDENITIGTDSGDTIVITGNLQVSGTTTTVNSTTVNLNDHNIVLDSGNSTSAVVNGAGITLEGGSGTDATFTYSTTGPKFEMKLGSDYEDLQVSKLIADELDIDGVINVGVDDTGYDVKFFGATSGQYMLWDESDDKLIVTGEIEAGSLDISGNVDIDGTLEADAITVNSTALDTHIAGVTVTTATTATNITASANNSTNETVYPTFVDGATGSQGIETDTGLTYNPSTGLLTTNQLTVSNTITLSGGHLYNSDGVKVFLGDDSDFSIYHQPGTESIDGGTTSVGSWIVSDSGNLLIHQTSPDQDIIFVNDDGSGGNATYMTLDGGAKTIDIKVPLNVGVDDAGHDVKFFGDTASKYLLWDASADKLIATGEIEAGSLDISGDADIDGSLEADAITVNGSTLASVIAGTTVANATLAATATVADSTANTKFPVVFNDESNALLDDTGYLTYNPSTGFIQVGVDITTGDSSTSSGGITITGYGGLSAGDKLGIPLALSTAGAIANFTKGGATGPSGKAHIQYRNFRDYPTSDDNAKVLDIAATSGKWGSTSHAASYIRFSTAAADTDTTEVLVLKPTNEAAFTGEVSAASLDISGDADIDGTLEADAYTVDGTTLAEYISDTVGAMFTSNTETGITATYQDGDNTIDLVVGLASTITVTDSNTDTDFPIVFHDESNGLLDDTGRLEYNPNSGKLIAPGEIEAVSLDISGDADIDGTLETDALTIGGSAISLNDLSDVLIETNSIWVGSDPSSTTSSAYRNCGVGISALDSITTGSENVCVGTSAGTAITEGNQNILIGHNAGSEITDEGKVIGIGENAMTNAENYSIGIGYLAGRYVEAGYNIAIGNQTMQGDSSAKVTGEQNIAIGGSASLGDLTDGARNIGIGFGTAGTLTTGDNNIYLGYGITVSGVDAQNEIAIGDSITAKGSNTVVLGNASTTVWLPYDDNGVDLGSAALSFKDAWVQGTLTGGAITTTGDVDVTGSVKVTQNLRRTVTTASESGGTHTCTLVDNDNFNIAVTNAATTIALVVASENVGQSGMITITNPASVGSLSFVALPSYMLTPSGATINFVTTANAVSIISYYVHATDKVLCNYVGNFA